MKTLLQKPSPIFGLIIISFLVLGFLYASLTPPWQTPDEPAHYNFVRYIAEHNRLPELTLGCYDAAYLGQLTSERFPPHLSVDSICYEHYQPPLYYGLASIIYRLSGGNLIALRLFSVGLGAISLIFVYQTVRLFMPDGLIPLATTAFVAFVPMHITMLAAVNNDSLAELLFVAFIYLLLRWHLTEREAGRPLPFAIGTVLGFILLTKVTIYIAIPLAAFVLLLGHRTLTDLIKHGLRLYLPALIIALPWYSRNLLLYGGFDILGLQRHDAVVVGQLRTSQYMADIGLGPYLNNLSSTLFHSFWGQFGWMAVPMDNRVYQALLVLQLLAFCGLILWLMNDRVADLKVRQSLWVMAAIILLASGILIGLNLSFVQFQGRYLFTALMPIGLFFSLGLAEAFHRKWAIPLAGVLLLWAGWIGLRAVLGDGLDKWGVLITGLSSIALLLRWWLPFEKPAWFLTAIYAMLAGLAFVSIWWFIIPNLT